MIMTIASGKGGTGKTTFAVNLAYALARRGEQVRLLDCDVEEPNDHLFVAPAFSEESEVTVLKPTCEADPCTGCGKCAEVCRYNALAVVNGKVLVFKELCHACGACSYVCPEGALRERPFAVGHVQAAPRHAPFYFAHGKIHVGESLAPKVVEAVKTHQNPNAINIIDASPGSACPVVKALEGADVAVLLTEPTPFGLNDLKFAACAALEMGIPTGIVINRSDGTDRIISDWADAAGIPVLGRIPFERRYAETYSRGHLLVDRHEEVAPRLLRIYERASALKDAPVPAPPGVGRPELSSGNVVETGTGTESDYREITVVSGKGGTGKTTVTASFAILAGKVILSDNDVDAADLHLLFNPTVRESHAFLGGVKAAIEPGSCVGCGRCELACHFGALRFDGPGNDVVGKTWQIDQRACEGCGFCELVCPVNAVKLRDAETGHWFVSQTDAGWMVHARLGIAEENSGRLVTEVRNRASALAARGMGKRVLSDGPPGIACPVIASISGTDLVVAVTEPTVSGVHDLERVLDLSAHFNVPTCVVINKADLNAEQVARIERLAAARKSAVVGYVPFDRAVHDALMSGQVVVQNGKGPAAEALREAWKQVLSLLEEIG